MGQTKAKRHHTWVLTSQAGDNPETHVCSSCGVIRKKFSASTLVKHRKTPAPTCRYISGNTVFYHSPFCTGKPYARK